MIPRIKLPSNWFPAPQGPEWLRKNELLRQGEVWNFFSDSSSWKAEVDRATMDGWSPLSSLDWSSEFSLDPWLKPYMLTIEPSKITVTSGGPDGSLNRSNDNIIKSLNLITGKIVTTKPSQSPFPRVWKSIW